MTHTATRSPFERAATWGAEEPEDARVVADPQADPEGLVAVLMAPLSTQIAVAFPFESMTS